MKSMFLALATLFLLFSCTVFAQTGIPFVNQPLVPASIAPGGPDFTLTINGTGFAAGASVNWNGSPRPTTVVSPSKIIAIIPASNVATATTATITVSNPTPGGGTSSVAYFPVGLPASVFALSRSDTTATVANFHPSVLSGDFNRDGKADVVTPYNYGGILFFAGNGDGSLQAPITSLYACPGYYTADYLTAGDFNNDGALDLVLASEISASVCLLLGNGDGTFQLGTVFPLLSLSNHGVFFLTADFNADGKLDLAVADSDVVTIFLGNGDGTLQPAFDVPGGTFGGIGSIAVGDFNRDGNLDMAVAGNGINIIPGNGDGTFQAPTVATHRSGEVWLVAADFDSDGILDLAASGTSAPMFILLGDGSGGFREGAHNPIPYGAACQPVGDFNNNGHLDIVCLANNLVTAFLGNGDGKFQKQGRIPAAYNNSGLMMADFNGDGYLDLVQSYIGGISMYLQTSLLIAPGALDFAAPQLIGTTSPPLNVMLTNTGSSPLNITTIAITGTYSSAFAQTNDCGTGVAAGATCTVTVTFTPTDYLTTSASLAITDDAIGSPQLIGLTGTVQPLQLTPGTVDFGDVAVGHNSSPQTITLKNLSTGYIRVAYGLGIGGPNPGDFSQSNNCDFSNGFMLPGASCTITVTFKPTTLGLRQGATWVGSGRSAPSSRLSGSGT